MNKKPKVVFTYVEAGLGHIAPLTGVANAFEKKYGKYCEIVNTYLFAESKNEKVRNYGKQLSNWTKTVATNKFVKNFEGFSYLFSSKTTLAVLDRKFKEEKNIIMEEIKNLNPDLLFSTYYSPSHFAIDCRKKYNMDFIVGTYTPDPIIYPAWDKRGDLFFVNNDNALKITKKKKFRENSLHQVPFILRETITNVNQNKQYAKKLLDMPDKKTVLITSGAYGVEKDKKIVKQILEKNIDINLIIICGKNEQLFKFYTELKDKISTKTNFIIVGFTTQMEQYIVASDLVLGKSGASAICEALFLNAPFVVTSYANFLEKAICKYYATECKYCLKIFSVKKIIHLIEQVANGDESAILPIKEKMKDFSNPTGAEQVADILFEELNKKFNLLEKKNAI